MTGAAASPLGNTRSFGFDRLPAEALFLLSAIAQYSGAVIAKKLFDEVDAGTVALIRVASAAVALVLVTRAWRRSWTVDDVRAAAFFGVATAAMNLFFYLGIQRIDLGVGVAIEFIGPISVAAARTRSRRNWIALVFAAAGVLVLAGLELDNGDPVGLVLMLCASACWAGYIVLGARVSRRGTETQGLSSLGLGLIIGALVISPFGFRDLGTVFASGDLVVRCVAVGMFSTAIGYGIDQWVLKRMPTRRYALMLALLPVVAVIAGTLFLGERPTLLDGVGMALVLIGVVTQERAT